MADQTLTDAIYDTAAEVSRSTTALLRQAVYVRDLSATVGVVNLAGGEVEVQMNGITPKPGDEVSLLQQGYQLLLIGPAMTSPPEIAVQSTAPTDLSLKLWMRV